MIEYAGKVDDLGGGAPAAGDLVVIAAGTHGDAHATAAALTNQLKALVRQTKAHLVWMETPPTAFRVANVAQADGEYDPVLLKQMKARGEPLGCVATVANTRTHTELCALAAADVTPHLAGVLRLEGIESLGHAHVGGGVGTYGDCTHYCMPGVPDELARALYTLAVTTLERADRKARSSSAARYYAPRQALPAPRLARASANESTWSRCASYFGRQNFHPLGEEVMAKQSGMGSGDIRDFIAYPRWPEPCVLAFWDALKKCSKHHAKNNLLDCVNIAPAGSGTQSLSDALRAQQVPECPPLGKLKPAGAGGHHGCVHHSHVGFSAMTARQMGAKCVIMTFRDAVGRIESGWRWQMLSKEKKDFDEKHRKGTLDINAMIEQSVRESHLPTRAASFSFLQARYLAGLSAEMCAAEQFEVHLLCTEDLDNEFVRLGRTFGVQFAQRRAHSRSKDMGNDWRNTAANLSADVVAHMESLYYEDQLLHRLLCADHMNRTV